MTEGYIYLVRDGHTYLAHISSEEEFSLDEMSGAFLACTSTGLLNAIYHVDETVESIRESLQEVSDLVRLPDENGSN